MGRYARPLSGATRHAKVQNMLGHWHLDFLTRLTRELYNQRERLALLALRRDRCAALSTTWTTRRSPGVDERSIAALAYSRAACSVGCRTTINGDRSPVPMRSTVM